MKRGICLVLFLVLAVSFFIGTFVSTAEAKVEKCWTICEGGYEYECCEFRHGFYVIVRCHIVNPETPC